MISKGLFPSSLLGSIVGYESFSDEDAIGASASETDLLEKMTQQSLKLQTLC